MTVGPITWLTIHEYCKTLPLSEEQYEAMHYHIKALDSAFLKKKG